MPRKKKEAEVATPEVKAEVPETKAKDTKEVAAKPDAQATETKEPPKNIILRNINPAMMKFNIEKDAYNKEGEKTGNKYKVAQIEFKDKDGVTNYFDVNPKDVRANKKSPDAKASSYSVRLNPESEHTVRRAFEDGDTLKENETLSKSGKVAYHKETALELQKNVQDASHALLDKFKAQAAERKAAQQETGEKPAADKSARKLPDVPTEKPNVSKDMQAGE